MFWLIIAMLVMIVGFALRKQRKGYAVEREPWEADPEEDEPLDLEEIRRAEEEWDNEGGWEEPSEEEWR